MQTVFAVALVWADNPIRIGVISSLDPIGAPFSMSANLGLELARDEINLTAKRKFELIFEDDQFQPKNAVSAFHRLINQKKVDLLIGPQVEQTLAAVMHLAKTNKRLLITTVATTPTNTDRQPFVVHSASPDKIGGRCLADAIKRAGHKRITFLTAAETYSQSFAGFVKDNLDGVEWDQIDFNPDTEDYKPLFLRVRQMAPDALVLFFVLPAAGGKMFKRMAEMKLDLPVFTNEMVHNSSDFLEQARGTAEGATYCLIHFDPEAPKIKNLLIRMKAKPILPAYAVASYDTLHWLAKLIAAYGTDNERLRRAIYEMSYQGVYTSYSFDEFGDLRGAQWEPWEIKGGSFLIQTTN